MKTSLIILSCGYAESAMISWLIFDNLYDKFENGFDALHDLAKGLFKCWGGPYGEDWIDDWFTYLENIHGFTNDCWGYKMEEYNWRSYPIMQEVFNTPKNEILCIQENAEIMLTATFSGEEFDNPYFKKGILDFKEEYGPNFRKEDLDKYSTDLHGYRVK